MNTTLARLNHKFQAFLQAHKESGHSKESLRSYGNTFRLFLEQGLTYVDDDTVGAFLRRYGNMATRNKALAHFKSFVRWMGGPDRDFIGRFTLQNSVVPDTVPQTIAPDICVSLLEDLFVNAKPAWAVYTIQRWTGMRFGEVFGLTGRNLVHPEPGTNVIVFVGKRGKQRIVPLVREDVLEAFHYWTGLVRKPSESAIRRALIRAAKRIGGGKIKPHFFRSTVATQLWNDGTPVEQIAELLGHSNSDMVRRRYGRLNHRSLQRVVEAIR